MKIYHRFFIIVHIKMLRHVLFLKSELNQMCSKKFKIWYICVLVNTTMSLFVLHVYLKLVNLYIKMDNIKPNNITTVKCYLYKTTRCMNACMMRIYSFLYRTFEYFSTHIHSLYYHDTLKIITLCVSMYAPICRSAALWFHYISQYYDLLLSMGYRYLVQ